MSQADQIRTYIVQELIGPSRMSGKQTVEIRAGDVHRAMGLANAYPAVCSALRGRKLEAQAGIKLIERRGPENGGNVWFTFDLANVPPQRSGRTETAPDRQRPAEQLPEEFTDALILISCTKAKLERPNLARDLYCSPAFRMKKAIVQEQGARWLILSAKYGLVEPDEKVAPYDFTLAKAGIHYRREWAKNVLRDLIPIAKNHGCVISLAGSKYTELLVGPLSANGVTVREPLKGLRQGEQLAWLSAFVQ